MKISLTILFCFSVAIALCQADNSYNLMPQPASMVRNGERFAITNIFRVSVNGEPGQRVYAEASRFIRRVGEKTGYFLDKQGFVTTNDTSRTASLVLRIKRPAKLTV